MTEIAEALPGNNYFQNDQYQKILCAAQKSISAKINDRDKEKRNFI